MSRTNIASQGPRTRCGVIYSLSAVRPSACCAPPLSSHASDQRLLPPHTHRHRHRRRHFFLSFSFFLSPSLHFLFLTARLPCVPGACHYNASTLLLFETPRPLPFRLPLLLKGPLCLTCGSRHLPGLWFSTPRGGKCAPGQHPGTGKQGECTWRTVSSVYKNTSCVDAQLDKVTHLCQSDSAGTCSALSLCACKGAVCATATTATATTVPEPGACARSYLY